MNEAEITEFLERLADYAVLVQSSAFAMGDMTAALRGLGLAADCLDAALEREPELAPEVKAAYESVKEAADTLARGVEFLKQRQVVAGEKLRDG